MARLLSSAAFLLLLLCSSHATPGNWVQSTRRRWLQQTSRSQTTNDNSRRTSGRRNSNSNKYDEDDYLSRVLSLEPSDPIPAPAATIDEPSPSKSMMDLAGTATEENTPAPEKLSSTTYVSTRSAPTRPSSSASSRSGEQQPAKPHSAAVQTGTGILGGALTALLQNPQAIAKWSLTGVQLGLALYLGQACWQAAREVLREFEESASPSTGGGPILKPQAVTYVLQEIEQQKEATEHFGLHRIAKQLQSVLGWQLFDQDTGKVSIERLLLSLTRNEYTILEQCLHTTTQDAHTLWSNIHGIPDIQQAVIDRLHSTRICMVHNPYASLFKDSGNNNGILLYGPPGCGKTMLLQAVCATIRMPCLVLTPSVLLKKYVGETNQLIRSLFQLTQKLGDCVVVLDELDGLFRERRPDEHDSSRELKTEFLQWWDGLQQNAGSGSQSRILFVGATNRPFDVDVAILRRMSQSHFVGLPMAPARMVVLQKLLQRVPHANDINIHDLVQSTEGFSPSDLTQLVRTAAQQGPLRDGRGNHSNFRALQQNDLLNARQQMGPTPLSPNYRNALIQFHQQQRNQQQQQQPQQQQQGTIVPQQHFQQQSQQMGVQSTPFGNFFHAGTVSLEDYDEDDSESSFSASLEDDTLPLENDQEEDWGESEDQFSEEDEDAGADDDDEL